MENRNLKFICPKCESKGLFFKENRLCCPSCKAAWQFENGIIDLGGDLPYYGELPRERMKAIIQEAKEKGWRRTVLENFASSEVFNYLSIIATWETRADWLYLLDLDGKERVLDVGSGWGSETIPIARNTAEVVALDGTYERLEFLMVRAAQEGVRNIIGVRGSVLAPPLEEEQFDIVVLNGVLEWMGLADEAKDPLELQKLALQNVYGLLKKGGRLYIGIENSHGYKYLLGEPDDHSGVKNITFLERKQANSLMISLWGRPYRTYTHSFSGYERLLREAGFEYLEFYHPFPDYKTFATLTPLNSSGPYKYFLKHLCPDSEPGSLGQNVKNLERVALEKDALKDYVSSYAIIAGKD